MTTLERIKAELLDEAAPRPVVLLGAGASIKSGVPSAARFAEMIARWAYLRDHGRSEDDQTVHRSDWLPWLKRFSWYDSGLRPEEQYPSLVERLLTPREARMQFFIRNVRAAPQPSPGYVALAELIAKGWIRTVLTTNFDDLIEQACRANTNALLTTIRSAAEASNISATSRYAQLVYLHGTAEHYTDLNLVSETQRLPEAITSALVPILRDSPLIVIGYRGAEPSIMRALLIDRAADCLEYRRGIYWCTRSDATSEKLVNELKTRISGNFLEVQITGFDEAMEFLAAGSGLSVRALSTPQGDVLPSDEVRPTDTSLDDFDWQLVTSKIPACAARLDLPASTERSALVELLIKLNLAIYVQGVARPTIAGLRLLGSRSSVKVELRWALGTRLFEGSVLRVIDEVRDAMAELNRPYRLKGPRSVDVRAFEPLALKELLVNALVHRDYSREGLVRIAILDDSATFVSPGGVISTVDPERLGRSAIKGYRNQVLANALFGTGDMDKLGSGLIDVRRWAQEAGADATFVVEGENERFVARLRARPTRPVGQDRVAKPQGAYDVFYANALPVRAARGLVDTASCAETERQDIWKRHPGQPTPPFLLRGRSLITLDDLRDGAASVLASDCDGQPESFTMEEYCAMPDGERFVVQLLNESLGRHAKDLGLLVDWGQHRLWYPRSPDGDGAATVEYVGRVKRSTRTVVKVRRSATSGEAIYFEHSAVSWQFRRLHSDWYLFILPGWVFTKDGLEQHLPPKRVTSLSTRRAARDYNANVSAHLFFWAYVLGSGKREVALNDGGQAVVLTAEPLTAHMAGMPETPGTGEPWETDLDDDDEELDDDEVLDQ